MDYPQPPDDSAWFEDVVQRHSGAIIRYFARRAPRQDCEDLASEVLLTAWRRRVDIPRDAVLPWLYKTAGYTLANYRRKRTPEPSDELAIFASSGPSPEETAVSRDELQRALTSLSPRDREIILLHAWEGLSGNELAEVLGITRSGADAAVSRARKRLRASFPDVATHTG